MAGEPKPIPVTASAVEFSGSFTLTDVDPAAFELFTTPPRVQRATLKLQTFDPIPCPSPWCHPIAWWRWNPFMAKRVTVFLHNVEIQPGEGNSVTLTAHPDAPPAPDLLPLDECSSCDGGLDLVEGESCRVCGREAGDR